ncbi:MAG: biotin/lipoyl-binding protein [Phycisphaerae bacterium]
MKRKRGWIIGGSVVLLLVLLIYKFKDTQLATFLDGEIDKVSRGDLVIPVHSSGTVESNQLIEVKCKASGQVAKIYVVEGQMVNEGDLLVELDPVDEKRNLERNAAELERAEATLEKFKIALDEQTLTLPLNTASAEARVRDAAASLLQAETDFRKTESLFMRKEPVASEQEYIIRKAGYERAQALLDQAKADHARAQVLEKTVLRNAKQDVRQAEANRDGVAKALDDAQERLRETKVYAKTAGMVYSVRVKKDEVIQSGKTSLTGGTPLLYLADVSKMVVIAQVDEADIGAVRKVAPEHAQPGHGRPESTAAVSQRLDELNARLAPAAAPAADSAPTTTPVELEPMLGQRVNITVEAYRSETFSGVIERILPEPKKINNVVTFDVRIVLLGRDLEKLLGLQSDVEFTADKVQNVLRVRNEAIVSEGKESFVYVPEKKPGQSRAGERKVPVKIGVTDGIYTEVRTGLDGVPEVFTKRPRFTDKEKEQQQSG